MKLDHGVGDMPDDKDQRKEGMVDATADDTLHLGRELYARHAALSNVNTIGRDTIGRYGLFLSRFAPFAAGRWNLARENWRGRPNLEWLQARDIGRNQINGNHGFSKWSVLSRRTTVPLVQNLGTPIPIVAEQASYPQIDSSSSNRGDRPEQPAEAPSHTRPTHSGLSSPSSIGPAHARIGKHRPYESEAITPVPLEPTHLPGGESLEKAAALAPPAKSGPSPAEYRNRPAYLGPPIYQRAKIQRHFVAGSGTDKSDSAADSLEVDPAAIKIARADDDARLVKGQSIQPPVQALRTIGFRPSLPFVQRHSTTTQAGRDRGKSGIAASPSMPPAEPSTASRQANRNLTTSLSAAHGAPPGDQGAVSSIHLEASAAEPLEGANSSPGSSQSAAKPLGPSRSPALSRAPGSSTGEFLRSRSSAAPFVSAAQSLGESLLNRHRGSFITHPGNIGMPMKGGDFDRPVIQRATGLVQAGQTDVESHSVSVAPTAASKRLEGGSAEFVANRSHVDKMVETNSLHVALSTAFENPQDRSIERVAIQPFVDKTVETNSLRVAPSAALENPQDKSVERVAIQPFVDAAALNRQSDSPVKDHNRRLVHSEMTVDKSGYGATSVPATPAEPGCVVPEISAGAPDAHSFNHANSAATNLTYLSTRGETAPQAGSVRASRAQSETPIGKSESPRQLNFAVTGATHPIVRTKVDKSANIGTPSASHLASRKSGLPAAGAFGTNPTSTSPSATATPRHTDASLAASNGEPRPHPAGPNGMVRVASDAVAAVPINLISRRYDDPHRGAVMFGQSAYSRATEGVVSELRNDAASGTFRVAQMLAFTPEHSGYEGAYAASSSPAHVGSHHESRSVHRSFGRPSGLLLHLVYSP